jgi:hypothetical protein
MVLEGRIPARADFPQRVSEDCPVLAFVSGVGAGIFGGKR